jgi:hypothetical protein
MIIGILTLAKANSFGKEEILDEIIFQLYLQQNLKSILGHI